VAAQLVEALDELATTARGAVIQQVDQGTSPVAVAARSRNSISAAPTACTRRQSTRSRSIRPLASSYRPQAARERIASHTEAARLL